MRRFNKAELAIELKVNRGTVARHLNREDAPQADKAGKYSLAEVRGYIEDRRALSGQGTGSPELVSAKLEKLRLEIALLSRKVDQQGLGVDAIATKDLVPFLEDFLHELLLAVQNCKTVVYTSLCEAVGQENAIQLMKNRLTPTIYRVLVEMGMWCKKHKIELDKGRVSWPTELMLSILRPAWIEETEKEIANSTGEPAADEVGKK
jgi:hypothetical protein